MVHAISLAANLRFIVCESQGMSRSINFRNDFHIVILSQFLQVDKLLFGVETILGGQARISVALQTEGGISFVPVVVKILFEAVVVQMKLQGVHLVVSHELHIVTQEVDGKELAGTVEHKTTHGIAREVAHGSLEQTAGIRLLCHL